MKNVGALNNAWQAKQRVT